MQCSRYVFQSVFYLGFIFKNMTRSVVKRLSRRTAGRGFRAFRFVHAPLEMPAAVGGLPGHDLVAHPVLVAVPLRRRLVHFSFGALSVVTAA